MVEAKSDSVKKTVKFAKGQYLFNQNDNTKDLYIIKRGNVSIFKMEGKDRIELDSVGPGMVVGEIASIDGGPRSASGVAVIDTEVLVIPAKEFQKIIAKIPEYFQKIALILVQRLREVDDKINKSIEGNRTERVAAVISLMAFSEYCKECSEGFEISLKVIETELIDILNMSINEIADTLTSLAACKALKLDKNRVILTKREDLDAVAKPIFQAPGEVPVT